MSGCENSLLAKNRGMEETTLGTLEHHGDMAWLNLLVNLETDGVRFLV